MTNKIDANDSAPWTKLDILELTASLRDGATIEVVAYVLGRSGTVDEVRRKADELGLNYKTKATS